MKKIIVPTDFSEGAYNALSHAIQYAEILGSSVQVVHAYNMPPTGSAVMVDITDILRKNALEELDKLKAKAEELLRGKNVQVNFIAEHGPVVDVVNHLSKKHDADFVVMGTQGASGITEKWLGTNTAAAARNIDIPLIAVPAKLKFKLPEQVLFATDMKVMDNPHALDFITRFTTAMKSRVKFLHVQTSDEEQDEKRKEAYRNQVKQIFKGITPVFSYYYDEEIEDGISEAVKTENPDLLVTVRHEYGFFTNLFHSSTSQHIVNTAALPILVIKG